MQDYYEVLQVHPKSDQETIQAAYERLSQRYDPSKMDGLAEELAEIVRRKRDDIDRAYTILSNAKQRASYDKELRLTNAQPSQHQSNLLEQELSEDELIDYRPLPPAHRQERPPDFNTQPYLSPHVLAQKRGRETKPAPFLGKPAMVAALLTFIIGFSSLVITEGGTPRTKSLGTAQMLQTQTAMPPAAEELATQFEGQIVAAKQVAKEVPDNPNAWINLGNTLYDSVQIVQEHMPDSATYRQLLPRWLEATEAYSKALTLDPKNGVVRSDLGVSLCYYGVGVDDQRYVEQGIKETRQAAKDSTDNARVLLNLGTCLVSAKPPQTQEALENWRKILLLPNSEQGVLQQAKRLIQQYQ